jgi:hypothetical protein
MKIKCSQCGADIEVLEDVLFLICPYCSTSLCLLNEQSFPHYIVPATLRGRHIVQIIRDFNKQYNIKSKVDNFNSELFYFPFWKIEIQVQGQHQLFVQPAISSHFRWMYKFSLPGVNLKFFSESYVQKNEILVEPQITNIEIIKDYVSMDELKQKDMKGMLIHYPFMKVDYSSDKGEFTLWIDASHNRLITSEPELIPPSAKQAFSQRLFLIALILFIAQGVFIPGNWKIPAFVISFLMLYSWAIAKMGSL